ncbi:hypothetical protein C8Q76DRAFT_363993 [Earliella scabrosa]|nr:hypothetical protein C8Q76DRAFT_363993 [Earliella scabrosa]
MYNHIVVLHVGAACFGACTTCTRRPQHVSDLLEDMGFSVMRSGENALTGPFKVVDLSEIQHFEGRARCSSSTKDRLKLFHLRPSHGWMARRGRLRRNGSDEARVLRLHA